MVQNDTVKYITGQLSIVYIVIPLYHMHSILLDQSWYHRNQMCIYYHRSWGCIETGHALSSRHSIDTGHALGSRYGIETGHALGSRHGIETGHTLSRGSIDTGHTLNSGGGYLISYNCSAIFMDHNTRNKKHSI